MVVGLSGNVSEKYGLEMTKSGEAIRTGIGLSNIAATNRPVSGRSLQAVFQSKVRDDCGDFIPTDDGGEE